MAAAFIKKSGSQYRNLGQLKKSERTSGVSLSEKADRLTVKQWTKQRKALAGNTAGCFMHLTVIPTIRCAQERALNNLPILIYPGAQASRLQ